jgi:hypothetical protein
MNPYLLPSIELGPVVVKRLIGQIDPERYDEALPGRFSPREAVAHLADWEPILLERMKAGVAEPGVQIEAYNEGDLAEKKRYRELELAEQLEAFTRARAETAAFLRERSDKDWTKTVLHPERGALTLADQANMLLGHDLYHIEHLTLYLPEPKPLQPFARKPI